MERASTTIFFGLSKVQFQLFAVFLNRKNGTKQRKIAEKLILLNLKTVAYLYADWKPKGLELPFLGNDPKKNYHLPVLILYLTYARLIFFWLTGYSLLSHRRGQTRSQNKNKFSVIIIFLNLKFGSLEPPRTKSLFEKEFWVNTCIFFRFRKWFILNS